MAALQAFRACGINSGLGSSSRPLTGAVRAHGRLSPGAQGRHAAAQRPLVPPQQPQQQLCHTSPISQQRGSRMLARAEPEEERTVVYNKEFGYSRKDVLIIIVALIAVGILMYEGLQAAGMSAGMAGNWVQLIIFLGICVGWVSTYLWRVANKKMTYAQQLQMYEEAVMKKRLEEMTEAELQQLMQEVEQDKQKYEAAKAALQKQQQGQQQ